jgi:hypothetical protein
MFDILQRLASTVNNPAAGRARVFYDATTQTISVRRPDGSLLVGLSLAGAPVPVDEQVSDPASLAGRGWLYSKDVGGIAELFYRDDAGQIVQVTNNGAVNGGGGSGLTYSPTVYSGAGPFVVGANEIARWDAATSPTLQANPAPADGEQFGLQANDFTDITPTSQVVVDFNGKALFGLIPGIPILGNWGAAEWKFRFSAAADAWFIDDIMLLFSALAGPGVVNVTDADGNLGQVQLTPNQILGFRAAGTEVQSEALPVFNLPWNPTVLDPSIPEVTILLNRSNLLDNNVPGGPLAAPAPNLDGDEFMLKDLYGANSTTLNSPINVEDDSGVFSSSSIVLGAQPGLVRRWKYSGALNVYLRI